MTSVNTASKFSARGAVAPVTGANRGLGRVFARELIGRGAARVYGGARNPGRIDVPGVVPIRLDITDPAPVAAVSNQRCGAAAGCVPLRVAQRGEQVQQPFAGASSSNSAALGLARAHLGHRPAEGAKTAKAAACDVCHLRPQGVHLPLKHLILMRVRGEV
jgi:NAD(P)-dependent dehydrogenase (short-subunit alcohol dehydrogenase family)